MTEEENANHNSKRFLILFFIGFFIILTGMILTIAAVLFGEDSMNFGAIIFIGPFPIVIGGAGPEAQWIVLFAIILTVLSIVMFLILRRGMRSIV